MPARFVTVDHDTPLLLPPDLRDWVPANHMVHFVMDAIGALNLSQAHVNVLGTGDAQYPPSMMLGLLIYCYATGSFSSRKIEQLTYDSVPVRYLCADTHPDHDSICKFRRENKELLKSSFHQVLECAARAQVLKVGDITLAIDGTKIKANASKHSAMSHDHAVEQMQLLEDEIAQLLAKAEDADSTPLREGLSIPEEIKRREDRIGKIKQAVRAMEEQAKERFAREKAEYEEKLKAREDKEKATGKKPGGKAPQAPKEGPQDKDQYNFTDPESRIMKVGNGEHFEQSYNAQAGVEIESRLIVTQGVSDAPNDKQQLEPALATCSPVIKSIDAVLVDSGYYSEAAIHTAENSQQPALQGTTVLAATKRHRHGRSVADLEEQGEEPAAPADGATMKEIMEHRLSTAAGKELYAKRKQTIEPVFGIIKAAMGFRQFLLRGMSKVELEWTLVTLSYNIKRLFHLGAQLKAA
jgi:transposase